MRSSVVRSVLATAVLAACSAGPAQWQSTTLQPLNVGWQQFSRVQSDSREIDGHPVVEGYLTNVWGFRARRIQLLVSGYDGAGARVGQLVGWAPFAAPPGGRVFFRLPVPRAASYEVAVFAWTWVVDDDWREFELFR